MRCTPAVQHATCASLSCSLLQCTYSVHLRHTAVIHVPYNHPTRLLLARDLHATCAHAVNTRRRADVSQDVLPPCYQCPTPVQTVLVGAGGRHICLSTSVGTGWPRHVLKPRARSTALGRSAPAAACSALRAVRWILHVDDGRHSHASHSDARLPQSHNGARLVRWSSVATYCPDPTTLEALLTTILRIYAVQ